MPQRWNSFASATPLGPVEYPIVGAASHRAPEGVLAADVRPRRAGRHGDRDARAHEVDLAAGDEVAGGEQLVDRVGREHHDVERLAGLHARAASTPPTDSITTMCRERASYAFARSASTAFVAIDEMPLIGSEPVR